MKKVEKNFPKPLDKPRNMVYTNYRKKEREVWTVDNENYVVAFGNDENEVNENTYFHWAMMCDYEGSYKVVETNTIKVN